MIRTYVAVRDAYRAATGYDEKKKKEKAQKKEGEMQAKYPSKGTRTKEYAEGVQVRKPDMGDS